MSVVDRFEGKRILIWGYGREGKSTESFLNRCCKPLSVDIFEGKREDINEDKYDYIFKSPGIVMDEDNDKYTSQTQVFMEEYASKTVGITGTKGKSTTSSLLYTVLNACLDKETLLVGNIGLPCLDYFDHINEDTIVVYELSCHQLAHLSVSPHIAVFLNLFEDHLDYYKTMDRYFAAKTHISAYQTDNDVLYVGDNVPQFDTDAKKVIISSK
ncbi:MAG: UDP-N-acetylmuramoyl-L-alanine--D-glutamate ligase, partial [Lachnospiraceae bacterium]|nr:UDP-N-acetylmuramoyl-L-alanine--D-glutamate ligase [Lachnospiraceae bacterium]